MIYIINGAYPRYRVSWGDDAERQPDEFTTTDFATVMKWFIYRLEAGDTIQWEPND